MVTYNEALAQARVFLRDDSSRIPPNDWILITEQAREHFSKDHPQELVYDLAGTGTHTYNLSAVLTTWTNRFSRVISVETPTGNQNPTMLQRNDFTMYRPSSTIEQIKFLAQTIGSGITARIRYTAPHTFAQNASSTIDDLDKMLIALLMAAYAAQALTADFLKANRSNLPNDATDFSVKARDMQALADTLFKKYADMLNSTTEGVKSYFTAVKDFDMLTGLGDEYLIHGSGER